MDMDTLPAISSFLNHLYRYLILSNLITDPNAQTTPRLTRLRNDHNAATRGGYGLVRYEKEEVQKGVKQVFDQIGRTVQEHGEEGEGKWVDVDAGKRRNGTACQRRSRIYQWVIRE
ncbi:hypothetical protein BDR03DRAFT_86847 [Suillus americanus]|nr:hypothetical protein BDR03DRAFT_86847 [Suillus americanus]